MISAVSNQVELGAAAADGAAVHGEFVDFAGERYYAIRNVNHMAPFFISVISHDDHWLFVSSNGGLTAGRVSPETALFPYITVDRIHDCAPHTGSRTLLRISSGGQTTQWEPFNREHAGRYEIRRHLYKNLLGNKLCFEETNLNLGVGFRYTWQFSSEFGFVRQGELRNLSDRTMNIELLDGLQNLLPAGTPMFTQTNSSNLVDAYKWTELDPTTGLAFLTLYSAISDRTEPMESLRATTAFCLGFDDCKVLLSSSQIGKFRRGDPMQTEQIKRGVRGAYLVNASIDLEPGQSRSWQIVADVERSQAQAVALQNRLRDPVELNEAIRRSIQQGSDELARIMAGGDAFQATAEENVSVHHYANVLFNVLRGGIFDDQYFVSARDYRANIRNFNAAVHERNAELLGNLPERLRLDELMAAVTASGDRQLERLTSEYLPITFGRRHGDPSRPWNQFAIRIKDEAGRRRLSYQGNWRDIFQNWEALLFSYPGYVDNVIAKFVNASTVDGYNPYRITKEGIDWELEEEDNPWSFIGYWGDHQIIYLQKLLELSRQFHPSRLAELLARPIYSYANVPYRIKPLAQLLEDPKSTVLFDDELATRIDQRVAQIGADGKLVLGDDGEVYRVNLLEKLLVPLLSKLGNLVIDGGIWLNTQRPEWNDANNALVGQGLSAVTLYYLRRYVRFLRQLLASQDGPFSLSAEVGDWLAETATALRQAREFLGSGPLSGQQRYRVLVELGQAASRYRQSVYARNGFSGTVEQPVDAIDAMLDDALAAIDQTVASNRRDDDLYHAYNVMELGEDSLTFDHLYLMLEGQVSALSSGAIAPADAVRLLEALFESSLYRPDQNSFLLYPDRSLPGFLEKNRCDTDAAQAIPLLQRLLRDGDERLVIRDAAGAVRFHPDLANAGYLDQRLTQLAGDYGQLVADSRDAIAELYEQVFNHKAFTGRSGTMFGFEGLGSVYWHMVSKLLLAVQENYLLARDSGIEDGVCEQLGRLYYRVRSGLSFNKTPLEYGAFPTDPYSHTPGHSGAEQPGMTGQVKEEILTRFGELGLRVRDGRVHFDPRLLRPREFASQTRSFCYLDTERNWQELALPEHSLAFTWCQVPIVYLLDDSAKPSIRIDLSDGTHQDLNELKLSESLSRDLFERSGSVRRLTVTLGSAQLFKA